MVLKDHDIFVQVKFMDKDGTCYGTIDQSEFDGETFVFTPGSVHEIQPNVMAEANHLMQILNDDVSQEKAE